jgi:hypothetical protein
MEVVSFTLRPLYSQRKSSRSQRVELDILEKRKISFLFQDFSKTLSVVKRVA